MLPKNMKEGRVRVLSLRLRGLYRGALAKMFNNKLDVAMGAYDSARGLRAGRTVPAG